MGSDRIRFGPAGNPLSFYEQGHKRSVEMPQWLRQLGLDAYEYSFGRGVRLGDELAAQLGAEARKHDISLSVHAPYYINLSNPDEAARTKSRGYLYNSARTAELMGADRIVFHAGSCGKEGDRAEALHLAILELHEVLQGLDDQGIHRVLLCPETMGKPKQLGTLEEVLAMCSISDRFLPAIDFGHINALEQGSLKSKEDYERIINAIETSIGHQKARQIHVHFSHIQFGPVGEIKHLTFEDDIYGPDFAPLAEVFLERSMVPVVICESRDVMAEDALKMKAYYDDIRC